MSKRKLLLADDSITIQKVVNLTFADEGIEVISVGDGDSAMQKINESVPDLVLADVNMPGLSGYQICEKLKQNPATQTIPVILLVGSFEPFDEAEAYRVGADDYLTKPFQSIRQLVSKVSDLLESSSNRAQAAAATAAVSAPEAAEQPGAANESIAEENAVSDFYSADADTSETNDLEYQDTLESLRLDDAGMDDEMIQTAQVGSLPVDETQKFIPESQSGQTLESSSAPPVYEDFEPQFDLLDQSNAKKEHTNRRYSNDRIFQLFDDDDETETAKSTEHDFSGEAAEAKAEEPSTPVISTVEPLEITDVSEENNASFEPQTDSRADTDNLLGEIPSSNSSSSGFIFNDMDLLEIPSVKPKSGFESSAKGHAITSADSGTVNTYEKSGRNSERVNQFSRLSPEMIEAIAQKVAEKISDKAIREIAWELIPQLTAAIIKKMEQERPKE